MRRFSLSGILLIASSFMVSFLLCILPLSNLVMVFWPLLLPMVLIYWVINIPHRINIGIAWLLGLVLDALYGSLLGSHALACCIVAYFAYRWHRKLHMFPVWQQASSVLVLLYVYQGLLICIQGIIGQLNSIHWFWIAPVISMLLWPWLSLLLDNFKRHYKVS